MFYLEWFIFGYTVLTIISVFIFTAIMLYAINNKEIMNELSKEISVTFPLILFSLFFSIFTWPYIWYLVYMNLVRKKEI